MDTMEDDWRKAWSDEGKKETWMVDGRTLQGVRFHWRCVIGRKEPRLQYDHFEAAYTLGPSQPALLIPPLTLIAKQPRL